MEYPFNREENTYERWELMSEEQNPVEVTCTSEGNYSDALTRGRRYLVLTRHHTREQIRVRGDNERHRWYPNYLFDFENNAVSMMVSYTVDDRIENGTNDWVDVTITFNTGERRWCSFATPLALATHSRMGDFTNESNIHYYCGMNHVIVTNELSFEQIGEILKHMDSQDDLMKSSRPLKPLLEESEEEL
jgi:hypothetical protein